MKDAPGSGHAAHARVWFATGELPKGNGPACVGCHK
jgi:hypothetical protein